MTAAIRFTGVAYAHVSGIPLLDDLDLEVGCGETLVLLGRSGSGKTTTLRLANALLLPCRGQVFVGEADTANADGVALRRGIGYVIQEVGLFPHLSVEANVGLVPRLVKWPAPRIAARVGEMLDLVGLPPSLFARRRPHQLSGGQRQRVGLARALAADPPVLLCDEPFGALDPVTRMEVRDAFRALQRRLAKTVLFVTHDLTEAFAVGDRIALLSAGRLVLVATPERFAASDHPEAQLLVRAAGGLRAPESGGPNLLRTPRTAVPT